MNDKELQQTLKCLVAGNSDVILFGGKSSGKTTLAKKVLSQVYSDYYVYMSCIITDNRDSFLFLLSFQIVQLLKKLDSHFLHHQDAIPQRFKQPDRSMSINAWVKDLNKIIRQNKERFQKIKHIHICVDNIEAIRISQNFMSNFYTACKQRILGLKFSFFFVGTTLYNRSYNLQKPFNSILNFFMPKPQIKPIVYQQVEKSLNIPGTLQTEKNQLSSKIYSVFQTIENQIEKIKQITQVIIKYTVEYTKNDRNKFKTWMKSDQQKKLFQKIKKYGPIFIQNLHEEQVDKEHGRNKISKGQAHLDYEYYPTLILTSIYLANGHPETDDYKRFKDYKQKTKSKRVKNKVVGSSTFKKNDKAIRHNFQRIVAISETLQGLSKDINESENKPALMEKNQLHHSMDYYGCFEYLRQQGPLSYYGKTNKAFGGKIMGVCKEEHARDFFQKMFDSEMKFDQFIE